MKEWAFSVFVISAGILVACWALPPFGKLGVSMKAK